ncbi:MAG: PQQ-dependent sugar dehydrogenase [Acidimicrobiia bacterium]|nr:PQQ-dependent sugar dehydrogenase [Acidimicrobiia bacterium]
MTTPGRRSSLSSANLPYLVVIGVSLLFIVGFVALGGLSSSGGTAGDVAAPGDTTTTTVAEDGATTEVSDGTTSTVVGDGGTTVTTAGGPTTTTSADGDAAAPAGDLAGLDLALETIVEGLAQPTFATSLPGDDRIFVLERAGTVRTVRGGTVDSEPFLDIRDRVDAASGIEIGLLGLAFHPDDPSRVFVYYTDRENEPILAEFAVNGDRADPSSERIVLDLDKVGLRHNAGMLQFGPEGHLYIAVGDGGEYYLNPQDPSTLLGGILRIDVDSTEGYVVPPSNPFAGGGAGAGEVWSWGMRNPWRYWIDPVEDLVYIADVGQADWEEINVVPLDDGGHNLGWPWFEAETCWEPPEGGCDAVDTEELVFPVHVYSHAEGTCSVTGGVVYRGSAMPALVGHYTFGDWCAGWIRTLRYEEGAASEPVSWPGLASAGQVTSFGVDGDGEILVVTSGGTLSRIVSQG